MRLQKRKGTVDGYEWRCRNQSKDNRHDVVRVIKYRFSATDRFKKSIIFLCPGIDFSINRSQIAIPSSFISEDVAAVAEWYRYRTVACFVTGSSPVPLKTRRVGQRCTLNLSRAETSSRWCGVVVRRGGASSGVVHVT
ncbi:uncharacterized protein TNCV_2457911 [Trichonephila clavipes]|nr:uncharacterized protein TNCV_2457911 [Trichonephila clavipes]